MSPRYVHIFYKILSSKLKYINETYIPRLRCQVFVKIYILGRELCELHGNWIPGKNIVSLEFGLREYFKERGEQYGAVWVNVAPVPFGSLLAEFPWCCPCYLSVYKHNN